ncbi:hypothetical protein FS749_002367 [Ceratobasidium sp. UAMH 11750]|nr:hypothetical protein FS749_002367 [Ceratobasidium sp. UAMH 11750]
MRFFASTALVSAVAVAAAPSLMLDVVGPSSVVDIHGLSVKVTLRNTGDETLKLLNDPHTVLSLAKTNALRISSASGSPTFTGIKVKYVPAKVAALNKESTFTVLAPGQSFEITHDLAGVYNFTLTGEGAYSFGAANIFNYVDASGALKTIQASTNIHKFKLAGRLASGHGYTPTLSRRDVSYTGCTAEQEPMILAAAIASDAYVTKVNSYLAGIPANTTSVRYETWFGNFTTERFNTVVDHFQKIGTDATSASYDCTSCRSEFGINYDTTWAYVHPDSPGQIFLCGMFWKSPLTGTDSRAGTIVHENSHFTVNGGTSDYAYTQDRAKRLAVTHPHLAVMNADSHEYFAENTPELA